MYKLTSRATEPNGHMSIFRDDNRSGVATVGVSW